MPKQTKHWLLVGFISLAMIMAGCSGPGAADNKDDNKSPEAMLETNKNVGWSGEGFLVDGSKSKDSDGEITKWVFDFGDGGQSVTVTDEEQAKRVNYTYKNGGEYTITLTVFDDGKDTTGQKSDQTTKTVAINQRFVVAQGALSSNPVSGSQAKSNTTTPFEARDKADRFDISIDITNTVPSGSSEVEIKVVDPKGDPLDQETVTISNAGQQQRVDLTGAIKEVGVHKLEMKAKSGAVLAEGDIEVYYDAGYTN